MNLQDQVITPQQSQRLVDLGVLPIVKLVKALSVDTMGNTIEEAMTSQWFETEKFASAIAWVNVMGEPYVGYALVCVGSYEWTESPFFYYRKTDSLPAFTKAEIEELIAATGVRMFSIHKTALENISGTHELCDYLIGIIEHPKSPADAIVSRINHHIKSWFNKQPK